MEESVSEYPVCVGHMCFIGEGDIRCSAYGSRRPELGASGVHKISYIPFLPRLEAMVADKAKCRHLYDYLTSVYPRPEGMIRDFCDTASYRPLCDLYGDEQNLKDDIFLAVSTDGFQAFKNKSYDVWPVVAIICNLPPHVRFAVNNVITISFVPSPHEPKNLQSFLKPLVGELEGVKNNGGMEVEFYDGSRRRVRAHISWFTGDLSAVKKCSGSEGHNGKPLAHSVE